MIKNFSVGDNVWMTKDVGGEFTTLPELITEIKETSGKRYYKVKENFPVWRSDKNFFSTKEEADDNTSIRNIELQAKLKIQRMVDTFWDSITEDKYLNDGIYDITDIEFFSFRDYEKITKHEEIQNFILEHPDYAIAFTYEVSFYFILSKRPNQINTLIGSGFNYGSNNIITNCPSSILIVAENE